MPPQYMHNSTLYIPRYTHKFDLLFCVVMKVGVVNILKNNEVPELSPGGVPAVITCFAALTMYLCPIEIDHENDQCFPSEYALVF
ncbi:hypothetical protein CVT25_002310 [Psilocybe cyanescens]|uniref:Uncharacterized protein n=1 Tax=Psilocybe cyanescens TaxID=93625 RepID=A0A409WKM5_PSICY|nr:hypothetical protein CVT25_002310 [Psilocybe cyanescens]